jgi:hypothetical protein
MLHVQFMFGDVRYLAHNHDIPGSIFQRVDEDEDV